MMKTTATLAIVFFALLTAAPIRAEDGERTITAYFQSRFFNAPILDGWENQSAGDIAQFYLAGAQATIRSAAVATEDAIAAAEADLATLLDLPVPQPTYSGKVNLADGTWNALVYDFDDRTTASAMARRAGGRSLVISFVERDPAARTALLALARGGDALADAEPEIAIAAETVAGIALSDLAEAESAKLPSGEWLVFRGAGATVMGMVFGNDSYVALRQGAPGDLAALADAYNRALLGFFITPDNSLYLALGLAVVFVILGTLVGSLFWRERGIRKDLGLLAELARAED